MDRDRLRSGLKLIARGIEQIADALGEPSELTDLDRELGLAREWGTRGLTQRQASELCAKWGFPGQKVSAWVRGGWAEIRADDLRYLTPRTHEWLAKYDNDRPGHTDE